MDRAATFTAVTILHACGHTRQHNVPAALDSATLQSLQLNLAQQPCSDCVVEGWWEQFGSPSPP